MFDRHDMASIIDHTLLVPEATVYDIVQLCNEAVTHSFCSICVNPSNIRQCWISLPNNGPKICSVVGFPLGANRQFIKTREAVIALNDGATEIDMVINIGKLMDGDFVYIGKEIACVEQEVHGAARNNVLKVILETAALTNRQIIDACKCARDNGADFIKTSTGFHPAGGTTVDVIGLMKQHCCGMGIKASGGIRTSQYAIRLINAGAERLGIGRQNSLAIMREMTDDQ